MAKQKIMQYAVVGVVLVAVWTGCFLHSASLAQTMAEEMLEQSASSIVARIEEDARRHIDDTRRALAGLFAGDMARQQWYATVVAMSEMDGKSVYYLMDDEGTLHDGAEDAYSLGAQTAQAARADGYAVVYLPEWKHGGGVATIIELSDASAYCLVEIESVDQYAERLAAELWFPTDYAILFNQAGAQERVLIKNGESSRALASSVQNAAQGALAKEEYTIQAAPGNLQYNVTLPLAMPEGWIIGTRVLADAYVPMQGSVIAAYVVVLIMCICLVVFFIVNDVRLRRRHIVGASHDSLTGLWSQTAFENVVTAHFRRNPTSNYCFVSLDIVAFHRFNTLYDHVTGDRLLRVIGDYIGENFLFGTRLNSDLFMMLARMKDGFVQEIDEEIREKIRTEIGEPYLQAVSFKFGVYPLLDDTLRFRDAFDGSLFALRHAKSLQETRDVFYDFQMKKDDEMQRFIEMHMFQALENDEFLIYAQPKFSVDEAKCCGCEVLVRWKSQQLGFLAPYQFVPLFEQNGFIAEVDFYMLGKVLDEMQRLYDLGQPVPPVSINQSRVTISFPNYLDRLRELIGRYTLPLGMLEIEVTESALSDRPAEMVELVSALREMGLSVAMDDFGTGYSSLNTLRELPVTILKIDKEFLREADTSERGRTIIRAVIDMAKALNIGTVAEGVETGGQFDFLREAGCDIVQGYFLSKPMPYEEYEKRYLVETAIG